MKDAFLVGGTWKHVSSKALDSWNCRTAIHGCRRGMPMLFIYLFLVPNTQGSSHQDSNKVWSDNVRRTLGRA